MIVDLLKLKKIDLYTVPHGKKMRACDVRKATGADVVINGTLFNWNSFKPCCDVKDDGKVLSDDQYCYWGLGWNKSDDHFHVINTKEMASWENVISCAMLIRDGKKEPLYVNSDVTRPAARTAVFATRDCVTHVLCDKKARTPAQLQSYLMGRGDVIWALMLDGGGSSQLSQAGPHYVYSQRCVANYLCFWLEDTVNPNPAEPSICYQPAIRAYSLEQDGDKKVSEHFLIREFRCKDGSDPIFIAEMLPRVLEEIRAHFGKPVIINSGYRTPPYNQSKGGAEHSQHMYGTAADIRIDGIHPADVADYARQIMANFGGVGRYDSFTHVDVRKKKANW